VSRGYTRDEQRHVKYKEVLIMGLLIRHLGGFQDGTIDVNPNTLAYVAGQPLKVNTSGQLELCLCYREGHDDGYCGLAKGWSGSVTAADPTHPSDIYNGKATYLAGFNQFKLDNNDPRNVNDDYPYDTNDVYQPGDDLYINTVGKLTNAAGPYDSICADATPVAYVVAVGAGNSYLIINQVR
jgi:hypothetical protein